MQKILSVAIIILLGCTSVSAAAFNASVSKDYDIEFEKIIIDTFKKTDNLYDFMNKNDDIFYQRKFLPLYILSRKDTFDEKKDISSNIKQIKVPNIYNLTFSNNSRNTALTAVSTKHDASDVIGRIQSAETSEPFEHVKKIYQQIISEFPNRIEILYKYSLYLYSKGDYNTAIAYLNSVKIKDRNFVLASYTLANIYYDMKDYKNSIRHNLDVISKNPYCADAFYNIASALEQLKEFDLAIEYYKKCLAVNSNDKQAQDAVKRLQTFKNASAAS